MISTRPTAYKNCFNMSKERMGILIRYARDHDRKISTAKANELLRHSYYHNHQHYVQEILYRLVKSGIFLREKRGHFIINPYPPSGAGVPEDLKNHPKLF